MKKLFITICMIVMLAVPFTAMADSDSDSSSGGVFSATAYDADGAIDFYSGQNAGAFGAAGGVGFGTSFGAGGIIGSGNVWGDATATGSSAPVLDVGASTNGVYSNSTAGVWTGATLDVGTDIVDGFGAGGAGGLMSGFAAQGTVNSSFVTPQNTDGFSVGLAMQGSAGEFVGGTVTFAMGTDTVGAGGYSGGSVGDPGYYIKDKNPQSPQFGRIQYFKNGHPENSSEWTFLGTQVLGGGNDVFATANAGAEISMLGGSYSNSYRYTSAGTEGMGTIVGAFTNVNSSGYNDSNSGGGAFAGSNVDGGWTAKGGVSTLTVQTTNNGGASAFATGSYSGNGNLGTGFIGSAIGYSKTAASNGVMSAGAGMSVTSTYSSGPQ